jgi:hypothetical protein
MPAVADPFRKFPREESWSAAEVDYVGAWLHEPFREPVGVVEEPAEAGVEVAGLFNRENLMVMMT